MNKRQKEIFDREVANIIYHFRKDKWDLDYSFIVSDLRDMLLGFNVESLLVKELSKKRISIKVKKRKVHDTKRVVLSIKRDKK